MIPIDRRDDWHGAERIMTEEAQRVSSAAEAELLGQSDPKRTMNSLHPPEDTD